MYPIGTEWNVGSSAFTVVDSAFHADYQTETGDIILPDSDCKFIIVECNISFAEDSQLKTCSVERSDVYTDSHPLFTDPIFLQDALTSNGGNCILLFSIPIDESSCDISSYTMTVSIDVDGKTYSEDFSFTELS